MLALMTSSQFLALKYLMQVKINAFLFRYDCSFKNDLEMRFFKFVLYRKHFFNMNSSVLKLKNKKKIFFNLFNIYVFIYEINQHHISVSYYIVSYYNMENISELHTWLDEYSISHKNSVNILIHKICVPAIGFTILRFPWSISMPLPKFAREDLGNISSHIIRILVVRFT